MDDLLERIRKAQEAQAAAPAAPAEQWPPAGSGLEGEDIPRPAAEGARGVDEAWDPPPVAAPPTVIPGLPAGGVPVRKWFDRAGGGDQAPASDTPSDNLLMRLQAAKTPSPEQRQELVRQQWRDVFGVLRDAPERRAAILGISKLTRGDPDYIEQHFDEIQRDAEASKFDPDYFTTNFKPVAEAVMRSSLDGHVAVHSPAPYNISLLIGHFWDTRNLWEDRQKLFRRVEAAELAGKLPKGTSEAFTAANDAWMAKRSTELGEKRFAEATAPQVKQDGYENFAWWEKLVGRQTPPPENAAEFEKWKAEGKGYGWKPPVLLDSAVQSYHQVVELAGLRSEWAGAIESGNADEAYALEKKILRLKNATVPHDYGDGPLSATLESAGNLAASMGVSVVKAGAAAATTYGVGKIAQKIGARYGVTVPDAVVAKASQAAGIMGGFKASYDMEFGTALDSYVEEDHLKPETAIWAARAYGVIAATLETGTEMGPVAGMISPKLKQLFQRGTLKATLAEYAEKDPTFKRMVAKWAAAYGKGIFAETANEVEQQFAQDVVSFIGQRHDDGAWRMPNDDEWNKWAGNAYETAVQTAPGVALLGGVAAPYHLAELHATDQAAQRGGEALARAMGPLAEAGQKFKAPEFYAEVAHQAQERYGTGQGAFFFDAKALLNKLQDERTTEAGQVSAPAAEVLAGVLGESGPQRVKEALSTGQKLEVSFEEFAKGFNQKLAQDLQEHVAASPFHETLTERETRQKADKEVVQQLVKEIKSGQREATPEERPLIDLADQLVATGLIKADEAKDYVAQIRAAANALSVREHLPLAQVVDSFRIMVERQAAEGGTELVAGQFAKEVAGLDAEIARLGEAKAPEGLQPAAERQAAVVEAQKAVDAAEVEHRAADEKAKAEGWTGARGPTAETLDAAKAKLAEVTAADQKATQAEQEHAAAQDRLQYLKDRRDTVLRRATPPEARARAEAAVAAGQAPVEVERHEQKKAKKGKEKKAEPDVEAEDEVAWPGRLEELERPERLAVNRALEAHPDRKLIEANLKRLAGTAYAKAAIKALLARAAIQDVVQALWPAYRSPLTSFDSPGVQELTYSLLATGDRGITDHFRANPAALLSTPTKPRFAVNGSWLNCNPTELCAKTCYAATGRGAMNNMVVLAELRSMAVERDPRGMAEITALAWRGSGGQRTAQSLRLFDLGDISEQWVPYANELARQGVRAHIFSKRPEVLAQVSDFHLRLYSADKTGGRDVVEKGLPFQASYVYDGSDEDAAWLNKNKAAIGVILPLVWRGKFIPADSYKKLDVDLRPKACPVDKGVVALRPTLFVKDAKGNVAGRFEVKGKAGFNAAEAKASALAEKIEGTVVRPRHENWSCASCDVKGGVGCYVGATTEQVVKLGGARRIEAGTRIEEAADDAIRRVVAQAGLAPADRDRLAGAISRSLAPVLADAQRVALARGSGWDGERLGVPAEVRAGEAAGLPGEGGRGASDGAGAAGAGGAGELDAAAAWGIARDRLTPAQLAHFEAMAPANPAEALRLIDALQVDPLTQLRSPAAWQAFKLQRAPGVYLALDVNLLKLANDGWREVFGTHGGGDQLLRWTAGALREASREHAGKVFRAGGDEFMVHFRTWGEADATLQKLQAIYDRGDRVLGGRLTPSATVGLAEDPDFADHVQGLQKGAAKEAGYSGWRSGEFPVTNPAVSPLFAAHATLDLEPVFHQANVAEQQRLVTEANKAIQAAAGDGHFAAQGDLDQKAAAEASLRASQEWLRAHEKPEAERHEQGARGWTDIIRDGMRRVYRVVLTKDADLSTFLHESGHVFMDVMGEYAARSGASDGLKADWAAILTFIGAKDSAELRARGQEAYAIRDAAERAGRELTKAEEAKIGQLEKPFEKFARAYEAYLMEGKAPSESLAGAFQQFKLWLKKIYGQTVGAGVELNDEIRGVMDRMLATDDEIAKVQGAMQLKSFFRSPEEAGMAPEEWQAHEKQLLDALSKEKRATELRILKAKLRVTEKWLKREQADAVERARGGYLLHPLTQAWRFLRLGDPGQNLALKAIIAQLKEDAGKEKAGEASAAAQEEVAKLERAVRVAEAELAVQGEGERRLAGGELTPVTDEEAAKRRDLWERQLEQHPLAVPSPLRQVFYLVAADPEDPERTTVVGELGKGAQPAEGQSVRSVALPAWLSLDDYLSEPQVWSWTWDALRGQQDAPETVQRFVSGLMRQGLAAFPGVDEKKIKLAVSFARFLVSARGEFTKATTEEAKAAIKAQEEERLSEALIQKKAQAGLRGSFLAQVARFLATPEDKRKFDLPLSDKQMRYVWAAPGFVARWLARHNVETTDYSKASTAAEAGQAVENPALAAAAARLEEARGQLGAAVARAETEVADKAKPRPKLAYASAVAAVGSKLMDSRFRGLTTVDGGITADELASLVQGEDAQPGSEFLQDLAKHPGEADWAKAEADGFLQRQFPDVIDERDRIRDEVGRGLHGDFSLNWLMHEFRVLQQKASKATAKGLAAVGAGSAALPVESLKAAAKDQVSRTILARLDAGSYLRAEETSARKAFEEAAKGNYGQALVAFRQRILNFLIYRELLDAREKRDRFLELGSDLSRDSVRRAVGKASQVLLDAIDQILEAVQIADPRVRERPLHSLHEAVAELEARGQTIMLDPEALGALVAQPPDGVRRRGGEMGPRWQGLTVDQAETLRGWLLQFRAAAHSGDTVIVDGMEGRVDLDVVASGIVSEIQANLPNLGAVASSPEARTLARKASDMVQAADADMLRPELMLTWAGGKDGKAANQRSITWRALVLPLQRAKHVEADLLNKIARPLLAAQKAIPVEVRKHFFDKVDGHKLFPNHRTDIEPPSRHFELIQLALNMGNPENEQRVTEGRGITTTEVWRALDALSKPEWDYVQAVWDAMQHLWPLARDLEEREGGLAPRQVEARPVRTKFGVYRGGYYPAAYDRAVSTVGEKQSWETIGDIVDGQHFTRPFTAHSYLKERAEQYADCILLSPSVTQAHLVQVVHDIAFREAVKSTARILFHEDVRAALRQNLGVERTARLYEWLSDVGNIRGAGAVTRAKGLSRLGSNIRTNFAHSLMSYALDIAVGDVTNSMVGALEFDQKKFWLDGQKTYLAAPIEKRTWALSKSAELRSRQSEVLEQWKAGNRHIARRHFPGREALDAFVDHSYWVFEATDAIVVTPVWIGAYNEGLAKFADEQDAAKRDQLAVDHAEAIVRRIVPSRSVVDQSAILRDRGFVGSMMLFFGYLNTMFNRRRDIAHEVHLATGFAEDGHKLSPALQALFKTGIERDAHGRAVWNSMGAMWQLFALVMAYQVAGEFMTGRGPEPDESVGEWFTRKTLMGMTVNDLPGGALLEAPVSKVTSGRMVRVSARNAPVLAVGQQVGQSVLKAMSGKEGAGEAAWDLAKSVGMAFGVPYRVSRAAEYVTKLATEETSAAPPYVPEAASGVIYGERKNQPLNPLTAAQAGYEKLKGE